ncbi:penicillin-binding transpeptidase domain-containing protein [Metabacillus halosaccharovorans]|uniref:serine-type D-Ala-D-Ala carboxypeptidase n=1 Tax=Metabacillus halosaccharovorans TaxID=930124 RepID=A0ABT3DHH3_9BACI|nr:penicillin-binding transpeptidase domain-containing protein [Metabacillus halosaccharovorans]MCV9886488.1 penicillin-binding transpeptidase domain-containing protein [Metabacillus halosaccharovorans]
MRKSLIAFVFFVLLIVLSACSEAPTAADRFSEYIKLWNDQKFSEMYDKLSSNAKEEITKEDFVSRYEGIYEGVSVNELKVEFDKPEEEKIDDKATEVSYPFSLSMETVAGQISFEQDVQIVQEETEDGEDWFISWSPTMIFPQLEGNEEVRVSSASPERGQIFDEKNKGLAVNGLAYEIGIVPGNLPENRDETIEKIAKILSMDVKEIEDKLSQSWVQPELFVPIKKIDPQQQELLAELISIPSIQKKDVPARFYPYGEAAAHLTGYIGSITAEQLEELKDEGYSSQSLVGKAGLEQVFESRLKGETGYTIYVEGTDKIIAEKPPENGEDIQVTIDGELQKQLFDQLKGEAGTAVAMDPLTGETLALVSSPSYNPNEFIYGLSSSQYAALSDHPQKPLMARFNKTFSPGSSLKPIIASIGLKAGKLDPDAEKQITGLTWKKDASWGNYSITRVSDADSNVNLKDALIYSDNIYFAQLALDIGAQEMVNGLKQFGFEEDIDFPFPITTSSISNGNLSNEQLLADSGYGQGEILMSPFHLTAAYTTYVNNGSMIKPYLEVTEEAKTSFWKESITKKENNHILLSNLKEVVNNPNGTAYKPKVDSLQIAGKTGTAELKQSKEDKTGKENGWFVAVNTDNPKLLVTMMIEDVKDRGGSHYVVPKVKEVMKQYLSNE